MALVALDNKLGLTTLSAKIKDKETKDKAVYNK
jgi:hypothetical protein